MCGDLASTWSDLSITPDVTSAIIDRVATAFDVTTADIVGWRRTDRIQHARQMAMYLTRRITGDSYPTIARRFSRRDHTTVLHAYRAVVWQCGIGGHQWTRDTAAAIETEIQEGQVQKRLRPSEPWQRRPVSRRRAA